MSSLVVGGVAIKVAVSSPRWTRMDAVDRARAFDNTFRASQTGGAVRTWDFETPAVLAATEGETYKAALSTVASQLCSGDILAIPVMCSAELTDGVPTSVAGDPYVVLSFSLHEVQPAKALFRYAPGDTFSGESFTRSTTATYRDANGGVSTAAINVKRDSHYQGGVRSLLLEDARENLCLQSAVLGTTWVPVATTVGSNVFNAPDTTLTADKIQEDSSNGQHAIVQSITCALGVYSFSVWLFPVERTKCVVSMSDGAGGNATVGVDLSNGTTFASGIGVGSWTAISSRVESWGGGWYRVTITGTRGAGTVTTPQIFLWTTALSYVGTTGSGIDAWGAQVELGAFSSSYIPTTTVAVVRGADFYSLPFTTPPQEQTVYAKFVELGPMGGPWLFDISNATNTGARMLGRRNNGFTAFHNNGTIAVETAVLAQAAIGATVEYAARLFGDGSVDATQSLDGAVATSVAPTAANALAAAWSDDLLWINSPGTVPGFNGFIALQSFKVVAGARSLAEMRAL